MASVERPTYTQSIPTHATYRTEKKVRYACWTDRKKNKVKARVLAADPTRCLRTVPGRYRGCYRDEHGNKAYTDVLGDRSAALEIAINLEKHARAVREGRAPPDRPAGKVRLSDHLPAYLAYMAREGFSLGHRRAVELFLPRVFAAHRLTTAAAVDAERLADGLEADRRAGTRRRDGQAGDPLAVRTRNHWTATLKAFGSWLVDTKRAAFNPFAPLPLANPEKDRRRVRRHTDPSGLAKLVAAARAGGDYQRLSGPDRAALYLLALYTGLRAGALFRLTPESFAWAGGTPASVLSPGKGQKAGTDHGIPLAAYPAGELAAWLRAKPAGVPLFRSPPRSRPRTARILRHDLTAAGLPYTDAAGRVCDFHALRLSFGVMLAKAGVPLVLAQQLMQHSTPVLTANVYSLVGGELAGEVAKLPSLGAKLGAGHVQSGPRKRTRTGGKGGDGTDKSLISKRK